MDRDCRFKQVSFQMCDPRDLKFLDGVNWFRWVFLNQTAAIQKKSHEKYKGSAVPRVLSRCIWFTSLEKRKSLHRRILCPNYSGSSSGPFLVGLEGLCTVSSTKSFLVQHQMLSCATMFAGRSSGKVRKVFVSLCVQDDHSAADAMKPNL